MAIRGWSALPFTSNRPGIVRRPDRDSGRECRSWSSSRHEKARHELRRPRELCDHRAHLVTREDDREATRTTRAYQLVEPWQLHTNDLPVEEEERCQGLILRRATDLGIDGERGQKAGGFGGAQLTRVTLAVKQDVAADPADVGLLRPATVVPRSKRVPDDVDQLRGARRLAGMLACEASPLGRSTGCDIRRARHADAL